MTTEQFAESFHMARTGDITAIRSDEYADAIGLERFNRAMQEKLAKKRAAGRGGWNRPFQRSQPDRGDVVLQTGCDTEMLRTMLIDHVRKGDMVDVANLAMMIWNREHPLP